MLFRALSPCKPSSSLRAGALIAALFAAVPLAAAANAAPERPAEVKHRYKAYVGGVLIGKASLTTRFTAEGYSSEGKLETDGVAGWFVAAKAQASALGALDASALEPERLDVTADSDGEAWRMSIAFSGGAPSEVSAEPPLRSRKWDIDPASQTGALDPISAIVRAMTGPMTSASAAAPCERTLPVFDGRKRYDIVLEEQIDERVKDGVTIIECAARWTRVSGFKPKMMRKPDYPFTARFAIRDGLTVPVRIWGDTEFGGAVVVLR
ncbi:MAG: DUF3108 domain-containing protein [Pseudomonadota bacterium]